MVKRFFVVSTVAFLITALGHYYIYVRMIEPLPDLVQAPFSTILIGLWGLTFFGFPLARAVPATLRRFVELPMYVWMGTAYIIVLFAVITSPFHLAFGAFGLDDQNEVLAYVLWAVTLMVGLYAIYSALRKETVVRTTIEIKKDLPKELEDLKIVVLSDVHVAGLVGRRRMRRVARLVNSLRPDLVFVTGDLVDGSVGQLKKEVAPLGDIKPPLGVYYVTGNHEYYCNAPKWKRFLSEKFGWHVLSNENAQIEFKGTKINILGVEDRQWLHFARKLGETNDVRLHNAVQKIDVEKALGQLNILLAHQPKDARMLPTYSWIDLQVSGHTHGGQLWPLSWLVKKDQTFNSGLYQLPNGQQIYVTEGTSFWGPPMRLGSKCEVSLLSFKGKTAET